MDAVTLNKANELIRERQCMMEKAAELDGFSPAGMYISQSGKPHYRITEIRALEILTSIKKDLQERIKKNREEFERL